jgi:glycosyltransferase involved in cell wall biosynthesis
VTHRPPAAGRVTVAVPTRNRAAFLVQCIDSVRRQTHADLEIVIGDNASVDETDAVARGLERSDDRIRYIRHAENLGMVGNWNSLLRAATGQFFLLLSDDDLLAPDAIARLLAACARPGVAFAYGPVYAMDGSGRLRALYDRHGPPVERGMDFIRAHLRDERDVWPAATLFRIANQPRRELYEAEIGAVCDFLHRLILACRADVACVSEPVAYYRLHNGNETSHAVEFARSLCRLLSHPTVVRGELAPFAAEVRAYVMRTVRGLAVGAAVHGRPRAARDVIGVLEAHGGRAAVLRGLVPLLALAPVRLVAAWKRRALARGVASAAARAGRLPVLGAQPT